MYDDTLLEELLNQHASLATTPPSDPAREAKRLVLVSALLAGCVAVAAALVVGAIAWVLGGVVAGVVAFVLVGFAVGGALAWGILRPRDDALAAAVGGRAADPVGDARLLNVVEGLCTATGLRPPAVRVVDADGLNALAVGRSATRATLAVTSGLLAGLTRIELEGVLAAEVVAIRKERMVPATISASVPPALRRLISAPPAADLEGDRGAVALTRYPPGLIGAFEKMAAHGTTVPTDPALEPLWLAAPRPDPARVPLDSRIQALIEL